MFTLSPAMTRPHTQERLLSLFEQSPGSQASLWVTCHPLIGHWGSLGPSHWSESPSLLTATNWAWNLLEQNTTSHFLITSSFSHVVIAKKLISLLTKQRNISIRKYYHCISLRIAHWKISTTFIFKLASSPHSNNKISRGKIQFKLSILVLCQLSKLETQHRWQSGVHFSC